MEQETDSILDPPRTFMPTPPKPIWAKCTWAKKDNLAGEKEAPRKQKFKKPRRLPYEETEAKPIDVGQLLDCEDFKTDEGIDSFAESMIESGNEGS